MKIKPKQNKMIGQPKETKVFRPLPLGICPVCLGKEPRLAKDMCKNCKGTGRQKNVINDEK